MLIFLLGANRPGAKRLRGRNDQGRNDLGRNAAGVKRLGGKLDLGRNDSDSFVHSGLQDESVKVTISKLPQGSLACTVGDFPCTGDIQLTSRSEGRFTKTNLQHLQHNDRAMIRQICSIKPEDVAWVRSSELLAKLQLEDLNLILRERRLRWFGHVARSSGAISTAYDMQIDGKRGAGRPKQTW